jgi:hypothetical protein
LFYYNYLVNNNYYFNFILQYDEEEICPPCWTERKHLGESLTQRKKGKTPPYSLLHQTAACAALLAFLIIRRNGPDSHLLWLAYALLALCTALWVASLPIPIVSWAGTAPKDVAATSTYSPSYGLIKNAMHPYPSASSKSIGKDANTVVTRPPRGGKGKSNKRVNNLTDAIQPPPPLPPPPLPTVPSAFFCTPLLFCHRLQQRQQQQHELLLFNTRQVRSALGQGGVPGSGSGGNQRPKLSFRNVSNVVVQLLHSIKYSVEVPFSNIAAAPSVHSVNMQQQPGTKLNNSGGSMAGHKKVRTFGFSF